MSVIFFQETSLYLSHGSNLVRTLLSIASELSNGEDTLEDCLQPLVDFYSQYTITSDCVTVSDKASSVLNALLAILILHYSCC